MADIHEALVEKWEQVAADAGHWPASANSDDPGDFVCACGLPWVSGEACQYVQGGIAVLAAVLPEIRAEALRDATHAWLWSDWASAPRRADPVQERLANAQYVGDWLRDRAAREAGDRP